MRLPLAVLTLLAINVTSPSSHAGVEKLSELLDGKLKVTSGDFKIVDLVIDQHSERIAYILISRQDNSEPAIIPAQDLRFDEAGFAYQGKSDSLRNAPRAPKGEKLDAKELGNVDKHFGHEPFWKEDKESGIAPRFRPGKNLLNIEVVDGNQKELGKVVDAGLDPAKHRVLYVVIRDINDQTHAVPLSAFERTDDKQTFVLKVPPEVFFKGSTFALDKAWPHTVDREWIEYVQVRYGRRGVQEAGKAEERGSTDER